MKPLHLFEIRCIASPWCYDIHTTRLSELTTIYDDLVAGCLTRRFTSPSCSFFIRDHASILDIRVTSYPFTCNNWSPAFKAPVFSAAPPIHHTIFIRYVILKMRLSMENATYR